MEKNINITLHVPLPDEWEYRQKLYLDYDSTIHNAPYGDNGINGVCYMSEEWLRGFLTSGKDWYAYIFANGEPVGEVI